MKKTIIVTIIIIALGITSAYLTDIYRMSNNMDVIFGTWGHKYAPPSKSGDISKIGTLEETESGELIEQKEINIEINDHILSFSLPVDWNYETLEREENGYDGGVKIYNSDSNKYARILLYGENPMGVCGTGLTEKEMQLNNGQTATVGYYGTNNWEFIYINLKQTEGYDIWVMNQSLSDADTTKVLGITKTINLRNKASEKSFIGTIIEEKPAYIIVEPASGETERNSSDKIQIALGEKRDYLYGENRKVVIYYDGTIKETYPAQINASKISVTGYDEFEITVKESTNKDKKKILNNKDLYDINPEYNLYYFGLEEVYVNVNNKNMTLENALKSGYLTLDGIIQKANKDMGEAMPANSDQNMVKKYPRADYCNDGGTIEYHYKDYTIIKLHRLDGNRDVYIGTPNLRVDDLGL